MTEQAKILPQSSYDRLREACQDTLLWEHIDPDCYLEYEPVPDSEYWEAGVDLTLSDVAGGFYEGITGGLSDIDYLRLIRGES